MVGNDATPNAGVSIRIRGATSLRGNQEPLYVVDGVIISTANQDAVSAGAVNGDVQEAQNGLNGINPRDIESMEILKDCLLYTSPSPRDVEESRMPSSA